MLEGDVQLRNGTFEGGIGHQILGLNDTFRHKLNCDSTKVMGLMGIIRRNDKVNGPGECGCRCKGCIFLFDFVDVDGEVDPPKRKVEEERWKPNLSLNKS